MPPRYAYWTILVDELPTAFRAATLEDIQPTFARLKAKNPTARLVWFQNGKVWNSRLDAQEAMRARGERGREGDLRQRPSRRESETSGERIEGKLEWRPKGSEDKTSSPRPFKRSTPRPQPSRPRHERPAWQAKDTRPRDRSASRPGWKPKPKFGERRASDDRRPPATRRESGGKLEWRPKGAASAEPREKRKWVPKEEYKKSQGIEAKRDKSWRPGGEHKDPRQKYKDAKKAKWSRFKQNIRKRWEAKSGPKKDRK